MNGLEKKEKELKEKSSSLTGRKKEQQKGTITKQKLENLRKSESRNKKTEISKQSKKSSVNGKVSKGNKKDSARREKSCSMHRTNTTGNVETVIVTKNEIETTPLVV